MRMTEISAIHTMKIITGGRDIANPFKFSYGDVMRLAVFVIVLASCLNAHIYTTCTFPQKSFNYNSTAACKSLASEGATAARTL